MSVLVLICTTLITVVADEPSVPPLSAEPIVLLDDRLLIHMPDGTKVQPRQVNIMAAEHPSAEESRLVYDRGEKRLVVMAYELFRVAGPKFADHLTNSAESGEESSLVYKMVLNQSSFQVYQSMSEPTKINDNVVHVVSARVVNSDQTVQALECYANAEAASDLASTKSLFEQALLTLEPGKRHLKLEARTERLNVYSETKRILVDLPQGWAYWLETGPDFLVHRFREVVRFGEEAPSIGLYIGGHPSLHSSGQAFEQVPGTLVGRQTEWFVTKYDERVSEEAILDASWLDEGLMFHAFISGRSETELKMGKKIVQTMRISEK